jgi:hypothetical protein
VKIKASVFPPIIPKVYEFKVEHRIWIPFMVGMGMGLGWDWDWKNFLFQFFYLFTIFLYLLVDFL